MGLSFLCFLISCLLIIQNKEFRIRPNIISSNLIRQYISASKGKFREAYLKSSVEILRFINCSVPPLF